MFGAGHKCAKIFDNLNDSKENQNRTAVQCLAQKNRDKGENRFKKMLLRDLVSESP